MTRRTLIQTLATLCAWPFLRLRAHADAVKAIPTPANGANRVTVSLWDLETLIERFTVIDHPGEYLTAYDDDRARGRHGYIASRKVGPGQTVFRHSMTAPQTFVHYDYISGPKWWTVPDPMYGTPAAEMGCELTYRPGVYLGLDRSGFK